jgi:hypothetical protein
MSQNQQSFRAARPGDGLRAAAISDLIPAAAREFGLTADGGECWKVFLLALCGVRREEMVKHTWREVDFSTEQIHPVGGAHECMAPETVRGGGLKMHPLAAEMLQPFRGKPRGFVLDSPEVGDEVHFIKVSVWLRRQGVGGGRALRALRAAGLKAKHNQRARGGLEQGLRAAREVINAAAAEEGLGGAGRLQRDADSGCAVSALFMEAFRPFFVPRVMGPNGPPDGAVI